MIVVLEKRSACGLRHSVRPSQRIHLSRHDANFEVFRIPSDTTSKLSHSQQNNFALLLPHTNEASSNN